MNDIKMNKENNGFMACPFCGHSDEVAVMGKEFFYGMQGATGIAAITVECKRCRVEMWDHTCSEKNYEKRVEIVRRKWNKRVTVSQETEGDESNE